MYLPLSIIFPDLDVIHCLGTVFQFTLKNARQSTAVCSVSRSVEMRERRDADPMNNAASCLFFNNQNRDACNRMKYGKQHPNIPHNGKDASRKTPGFTFRLFLSELFSFFERRPTNIKHELPLMQC